MSSSRRRRFYKKRRMQLYFLQGKRCFWCNQLTKLPKSGDQVTHDNTATLDHLNTWNSELRIQQRKLWNKNRGEVMFTVMACYRCNNGRAHNKKVGSHGSRKRKVGGSHTDLPRKHPQWHSWVRACNAATGIFRCCVVNKLPVERWLYNDPRNPNRHKESKCPSGIAAF